MEVSLEVLDDLVARNKSCELCSRPFLGESPECPTCRRLKKWKRGHGETLRAVDTTPLPGSQEGDDEDSGDDSYDATTPPEKNAPLVPPGQRPTGVCAQALLGLFPLQQQQQQQQQQQTPPPRPSSTFAMRAFAIFSQAPTSSSSASSATASTFALETTATIVPGAADAPSLNEPSTPSVEPVELLSEADAPSPTTPSKVQSMTGHFRDRRSRAPMLVRRSPLGRLPQ